jgi:hypothetical protein
MRQQHLLQGEPTILGGASSKHDSCHSRFIFVVVLVWGVIEAPHRRAINGKGT